MPGELYGQKQQREKEIFISEKQLDLNVSPEQKDRAINYERRIKDESATLELGSKSWKNNTEAKRQRNKAIDDSHKISKQATAYTLEIHDTIKGFNTNVKEEMPDNADTLLNILTYINFTPQMFSFRNIRSNLSTYLYYIQTYNSLKEMQLSSYKLYRLKKYSRRMELLKKRVRSFCEQNKVKLSGEALGKNEKAVKTTKEENNEWLNLCLEDVKDKKYNLDKVDITKEQVDKALLKEEKLPEGEIPEEEKTDAEKLKMESEWIDNIESLSLVERIEKLPDLRRSYINLREKKKEYLNNNIPNPPSENQCEKYVHTLDKYKNYNFDDLRTQNEAVIPLDIINSFEGDVSNEYERRLKEYNDAKKNNKKIEVMADKAILFSKAWYMLTYAEARYIQAQNEAADEKTLAALKAKAETLRGQVDELIRRDKNEEIALSVGKIRYARNEESMEMRRADILIHDSEQNSYNAKEQFDETRRTMLAEFPKDPMVKDICDKILVYTNTHFYKDGHTEESNALKDLKKAVNKYVGKEENKTAGPYNMMIILQSRLDELSNGTLKIPEGATILNEELNEPVEGEYISQTGRGKQETFIPNMFKSVLKYLCFFRSKKEAPLFAHEPTSNDVKQHWVSNCYMVAGANTLCEYNSDYIKSCIVEPKEANGEYCYVRLYRQNKIQDDKEIVSLTKGEGDLYYDANKQEEFSSLNDEQKRIIYKKRLYSACSKYSRTRVVPDPFTLLPRLKNNKNLDEALEKIIAVSPLVSTYLQTGQINGEDVHSEEEILNKLINVESQRMQDGTAEGIENLENDIKDIVLGKTNMEAVYVKVKKTVPKIMGKYNPLSSGALWFQMIEKAVAIMGRKGMNSGYTSLWYGGRGEIITALTGIPEYNVSPSDETFKEICDWKARGEMYFAGSINNIPPKFKGIINPGHMYSVLGGKVDGGKKYVILKNPYATKSLVYGDSKDGTGVDYKGLMTTGTEGEFHISFDDFSQLFSMSKIQMKKNGIPAKS